MAPAARREELDHGGAEGPLRPSQGTHTAVVRPYPAGRSQRHVAPDVASS